MSSVDYVSAINTKGSGLNITQIVESLVEAETKPKKDLVDKKIEDKNLDISSIGQLTSEINTLQTSLNGLANISRFKASSGSVANTITVSDVAKAKEFNSDVNISSLATPQTLEFSGYALPTTSIGSGNITVDFGQWFSGASTDADSLFSKASVAANTSLGTPISHNSLGGNITILSEGGNLSSTTFTIVGTDMAGNSITEEIIGPTFGATSTGSKVFKTVTSITPDTTVVGGQATVGHSAVTFGPNSAKSSSTISIASGSNITTIANSLSTITGVSANVINKGDGTYSLVVRSDLGLNSAIRMTVSENSGDAGLSALDTNSDNSTHQTSAASDASLTVDGVTLNRSSNTISDLFDGYTLSLTSTTSSAFRVSASLDETTALANMKTFIDSFNKTRAMIEDLTKVAENPDDNGPLSDDISVKNIKQQLNKLVNGKLIGFGSKDYYASQLGLQTSRDGSLSINEAEFKKNFASDSKAFDAIFNSSYSSNSPYLSVSSNSNLKPVPGTYSFVFNSGSSTATLNGLTMTSGTDTDGNTFYASTSGDGTGIRVTPSQTVDSAFVYYGESLVEKLTKYTGKILAASGDLAKKEIEFNEKIADFKLELDDIDSLGETLEKRYKKQFTAMEAAISSLKNTGEFMTNLMDSFNKD